MVEPFELQIKRDVVYGNTDEGDRELLCYIYRPIGPESSHGCLLIHGGGFAVGDKERLENYALNFANSGITCVTLEYRLIYKDGAHWPQPIFDIKAAIG